MSKLGIHQPGHCKLTAERIHKDAEKIAARLAKGESGTVIAAEYDCNHITLRKHLIAVIGAERWRQLVYPRGPKPGSRSFGRPRGPKKDDVTEEDGTVCYICLTLIAAGALKCPNPTCGALQYG